jgi:hypothetical protein
LASPLLTWTNQEKSFYGEGRSWIFVSRTTSVEFVSSSNGQDWTAPATALDGFSAIEPHTFSVVSDGTWVHLVVADFAVGTPVVYRRGRLASSGVIEWTAPATARAADPLYFWRVPAVAVSGSGAVFVTYNPSEVPQNPECCNHYGASVVLNDATDGSWTSHANTPRSLDARAALWDVTPAGIGAGAFFALCDGNGACAGSDFDGASFGAPSDLSAALTNHASRHLRLTAFKGAPLLAFGTQDGNLAVSLREGGAWLTQPLAYPASATPRTSRLGAARDALGLVWRTPNRKGLWFAVGRAQANTLTWPEQGAPCVEETDEITDFITDPERSDGELRAHYVVLRSGVAELWSARCSP